MLHFCLKSPLFDAANDGTEGGGAGAGNSGISLADVEKVVQNAINGLDKRYAKQFRKHEDTLTGLGGLAKAFEGVKPKKLAKLLKKAGSGSTDTDGNRDTDSNDGENDNDASENRNREAADRSDKSRSQNQNQNQNRTGGKQLEDPFKKKKFRELEETVNRLVKERDDATRRAEDAQIDSKVNDILAEFSWAGPRAKGSAFKELRPMVQRDEDGDLVIGEAKFDSYIRAKVPEDFDYLLTPKAKSGSGSVKGATGKKSGVDMDTLGYNSKTEDLAEAGRELVAALNGQ